MHLCSRKFSSSDKEESVDERSGSSQGLPPCAWRSVQRGHTQNVQRDRLSEVSVGASGCNREGGVCTSDREIYASRMRDIGCSAGRRASGDRGDVGRCLIAVPESRSSRRDVQRESVGRSAGVILGQRDRSAEEKRVESRFRSQYDHSSGEEQSHNSDHSSGKE